MATKKSATFTGKVKPAPKPAAVPKPKPEPKKRTRLSFDERTAKAQAKYDSAVAKKEEQLQALNAKELKRDVAAQALSAKIGGIQGELDVLKAAGPKLPKAKDVTAAALTKAEKKHAKLLEQLAKEKETMNRLRAEKE
jgi:hypothetical protein